MPRKQEQQQGLQFTPSQHQQLRDIQERRDQLLSELVVLKVYEDQIIDAARANSHRAALKPTAHRQAT